MYLFNTVYVKHRSKDKVVASVYINRMQTSAQIGNGEMLGILNKAQDDIPLVLDFII